MKITIILLLMLTTFNIFTQTSNKIKIDIDLAVKYALTNNADFKKETINLNSKKLSAFTSWNNITPDISTNISISRKLEDPSGTSTSSTPSLGISIGQTIDLKTFFAIYQNYLDFKDGKINYEKFKTNLVINLKKAYYNILVLTEELRIKKISLDNAKDRYNQALIQFKDGDISELEKLNRELSYKTLIPELSKLENNYKVVVNQFKDILGIENNFEIELISLMPDIVDLSDVTSDNDFHANFDIVSLQMKRQKDSNTMNSLIAQFAPTFKFTYSFNDSFQKDPFSTNWFSNINKDWKYSNSINLSLSLLLDPFIPFSGEQVGVMKANNQLKLDDIDINKEIKKKKSDFDTLKSKLELINLTYNTLKLNVSIAEKAFNLTQNEFREGTKSNSDVNEAEKSLFDTRLKILSTQYDYISSILDLEYLLNIKITDKLNNPSISTKDKK